jgi:Helicase conserved C-terminal domain/SNF2-related domain/PLD-like domain
MTASLRDVAWVRFLRAPDGQLIARLYEPALSRAVRYDRCCAYFSSSVLSAAASGFGAFIQRILDGVVTSKPAIRLLVNEELAEADVQALMDSGGDAAPLIATLLERFGGPTNALQKRRLEMLAWLAREGWLDVKVGVMRRADGILHAKFGVFLDANSDAVVFAGSGNESASGVRKNYEKLEISSSWMDAERYTHFRDEFETLWSGNDPAVATFTLPAAVCDALIKFAPEKPPVEEGASDFRRRRAAILWNYALAAPFMLEGGPATCDAMAPVSLWPHQRRVVSETSQAWPEGRLLCDEVGMGKTIEAILVLRRLLAGRGVRRALLLIPANLLTQWQGELREKGGLRVPRLEGLTTLVWPDGGKRFVSGIEEALEQDILLLSRETARTDANVPILLAAKPWDIVLLDEAHAARRASQVEGEFNAPTLLLGLLRRLQVKGQARSFMLLSATPMQTHPWEPWDLLQVLGEGGIWLAGFHVVSRFYQAVADLDRGELTQREAAAMARILDATRDLPAMPVGLNLPSVHDHQGLAMELAFLSTASRDLAARWLRGCSPLSRRMHRNTRETLRRYHAMGLLDRAPPRRDVLEEAFDFETNEEREAYERVARYIDLRFSELEHQKPGKGFVMTIYRRRAASSPWALKKSLERRANGLKAVIAQRAYDPSVLDLEDAEEFEDLLNVKLTSALPDTPKEARSELDEVEELLSRVEGLGGLDTKRDRLVTRLKSITADGRSALVFTGYADSMEYVRDYLVGAFGASVASYSGDGGAVLSGSAWTTVSKEKVTNALENGAIKVLVCTDAASEGLNLQAAGAVVNFDLPWNPSKVEQRIGRVDRIGQVQEVLPIVNLYLQNSIDARVYRALASRCGLFETFVGPMQPVLSRAIRMLIGREPVNEEALARAAEQIRNDPVTMQAFPEDEPAPIDAELGLLCAEDTYELLAALDGTGISVTPVSNTVHSIGDGSLQVATEASGIASRPAASCIDGLDARQWKLLRELQQPGERLPLLVVSAEYQAFSVVVCGWLTSEGIVRLGSFKELQALLNDWDGREVPKGAWQSARQQLAVEAREHAMRLVDRQSGISARVRKAQVEAARLRLIEELGRTLICFPPDIDDLNGKFHRLASEETPSAERLQKVFSRLGAYPDWDDFMTSDLRKYRASLSTNQIKSRITGREIDAALADPRWAMAGA